MPCEWLHGEKTRRSCLHLEEIPYSLVAVELRLRVYSHHVRMFPSQNPLQKPPHVGLRIGRRELEHEGKRHGPRERL